MPSSRVVHVRPGGAAADRLRGHITKIQQELEVTPDFPAEVEQAAEAAAQDPRLPDLDRTDIPLVTVDPEAAMDLDQALHLGREGDGYVVHYAIADLTAFITPGDPIDVEANQRGQTLYGADSKVPLHPRAISEEAGSLLPDRTRPALLWTIRLDAAGHQREATVQRAVVRSRARYSYEEAQQLIEAGTAPAGMALLEDVGRLRIAIEAERGGISLALPEQEIVVDDDRWHLAFRSLLPVEQWNAQISLLTGFAAASMMLDAGVGLLRTLPEAEPRAVTRLRRAAKALHVDWPAEMDHAEFIRSLDPSDPAHAAMLVSSTVLLRGSGYAGFDGEVPEHTEHAGLAAPYAHVTAPLRRLVDRYASEICVALSAGTEVPRWVLDALPGLPETMQRTGRLASQYERMVLDLVEAGLLQGRVGDTFTGVIIDLDEKNPHRGVVTIDEVAIEARVTGPEGSELPLGTEVQVKLLSADVEARTVEFALLAESHQLGEDE